MIFFSILIYFKLFSFVIGITSQNQINSLYSLYNSTQGKSWKWKDEEIFGPIWSFSINSNLNSFINIQNDPCNTNQKAWQGITCSSTPILCQVMNCNIISIQLVNYHLNGTILNNFYELTELTKLILSGNILYGTISSSISQLTNLKILSLTVNQFTGSIPSTISSLNKLESLRLIYNKFNGRIPESIGLLSQLNNLQLYHNQLTGTVPSTIGFLSYLSNLEVYSNQLNGTIPSSIGLLTRLEKISFNTNKLSGSIPSSIGFLTNLNYVYLYSNKFTNELPSSIGLLSKLVYIDLNSNQLTNTLPSSLGYLSLLKYFYFQVNYFTGTIPSSLILLKSLEAFMIYDNYFSGTIPSLFGSLLNLEYLYLYSNQFIGTIPSSLETLKNLTYFYIYDNQLTGSIPSSLNNLNNLTRFYAYKNHLTGSIPLHLINLPYLEQIFLQNNQLSGSLHSLFDNLDFISLSSSSSSFSSSNLNYKNISLINFDVSGNKLSGSIPSQLFLISSLESIALSVNGFEGELPESICESKNVKVMSLDGLSSKGKGTTIPFTKVSIGRMMEGNIPDCVWKLNNLEELNLAGNGLRGKIGKEGNEMKSLINLTLSHNYLSGGIPSWLLNNNNLTILDLSHNKLTGDLSRMKNITLNKQNNNNQNNNKINKELKLTVNRLSGVLPSSLDNIYSSLDILSGNVFGCDNIPNNDENSEFYVCGSSEYDQSILVLSVLIGLIIILIGIVVMIVMIFEMRNQENNQVLFLLIEKITTNYEKIMKYMKYYQNNNINNNINNNNQNNERKWKVMSEFGKSIINLKRLFIILTITSIICSIPLYVLKGVDKEEYVTHTHQYQWFLTYSFLSGTIPGILLMISCFICLLVFLFYLFLLSSSSSSSNNNTNINSNNNIKIVEEINIHQENNGRNSYNTKYNYRDIVYFWLMLIINIGIVGTADGLYVWSTLQDISSSNRFMIQLSLSFFKSTWKLFVRSLFLRYLKDSNSEIWLLSCIGVLNNVIIPCIATSFTSPSCYQRLIVEPEDISSSYSYNYCVLWFTVPDFSIRNCVSYDTKIMDVLKLTPPFTYSYQCGSTILTTYIPIYIYTIVIQIIADILRVVVILFAKYEKYSHFIQNWLPNKQIRSSRITSSILNNLVLLLSFGLSSPILSISICIGMMISESCWLILIGKLLYEDDTKNDIKIGIIENIYDNNTTNNTNNILITRNQSSDSIKEKCKNGLELDGNEVRNSIQDSIRSTSIVSKSTIQIERELEFRELSVSHNSNTLTHDQNKMIDNNGNKINHDKNSNYNENYNQNMKYENNQNNQNNENYNVSTFLFFDYDENEMKSLLSCKWIVICTSCLFITLISWDIVGDKVKWDGALWVPLTGLIIIIILGIINHILKIINFNSNSFKYLQIYL